MAQSFNPLSSRWSVSLKPWFSRNKAKKFQSAFIAVVCLKEHLGWKSANQNVSIRFHRGGLSHPIWNRQGSRALVSIRFHRGGLSHSGTNWWRKGRRYISIRFHRGGLSHY